MFYVKFKLNLFHSKPLCRVRNLELKKCEKQFRKKTKQAKINLNTVIFMMLGKV